MNEALKFKKSVVEQFIHLKEAEIKNLTSSQREQLGDTATEDIDLSDPFESTRSQLQDEVDQQSEPIDFMVQELELLKTIRTDELHTAVTFGSLVETLAGYFLIGASQKQFEFEGKKMTGISVGSPLFKKMENMKVKAEFHFGNTEYIIRSVS